MSPSLELWLLAVTAAFLCGGIVWGAVLRTQVRQQSGTLREWIRREAALRKQFVDLFENATDAIYTHDLNYTITSWNRTAETLTGFTRNEMLAKNISDFLTAESLERAMEMTKLKLQGCPSTTYEIEFAAKDGRTIPVEISTRLIAEDGKVMGIQGAARDISERKKAQDALRSSERRYRLLFERNMAGVFRTTRHGQLVDCNQSFAQILGYSSREEALRQGTQALHIEEGGREARKAGRMPALPEISSTFRKGTALTIRPLYANSRTLGSRAESSLYGSGEVRSCGRPRSRSL